MMTNFEAFLLKIANICQEAVWQPKKIFEKAFFR
jgi:hypothetical protein